MKSQETQVDKRLITFIDHQIMDMDIKNKRISEDILKRKESPRTLSLSD
jgi:hypothetical protein